MKILIVTQYFWPENFKGNDIAEELVKKGHKVTVLTAKPNYPKGDFFEGYSFFSKRTEFWNGVEIVRCPIIRRSNNSIMLLLNYVSFVLFASLAVIFRLNKKYDAVFVQQLSPIFMALPGILYKKLHRVPLTLWVLDLWPESIRATLGIKEGLLYSFIERIVKYTYKNADSILISSNGFRMSMEKYLEVDKPLDYLPNWAEDVFLQKKEMNVPKLPNGFNVMFAGNVGEAQDFESILKAAEQTIDNNVNWIVVGTGRKLEWVKKEILNRNIANVFIFGSYPLETMPSFFKQADALLVSLQNDEALGLTVPAKVQAYLASHKIVLGMLNGEGADIINNSGAGLACSSGDVDNLIKNVLKIASLDKVTISIMENKSIEYYNANFDKKILMSKLESVLFPNNI